MRISAVSSIYLVWVTFINAKCPISVSTSLEYIIDHAVWRGWHQAVIYTTDLESDCQGSVLRLVKCLGINGIASAVNVKERTKIVSLLGIVIFQRSFQSNSTNKFTSTINQLTEFKMNTAAFDWLIVANSVRDFKTIAKVMNGTSVRYDQNIIVTLPKVQRNRIQEHGPCAGNFNYKSNILNRKLKQNNRSYFCRSKINFACNKTIHEINYYKTSERFNNIIRYRTYKVFDQIYPEVVPLWQSSILNKNSTRNFQAVKLTNFSLNDITKKLQYKFDWMESFFNFYVIQLFKMQLNSTLFVTFLGTWSKQRSMYLVEPPYTVEARNFMGETITIGRCNSSSDDSTGFDGDPTSAPTLLDDVLDFLTMRLNATPQTRYYPNLGYRTYEGIWTGLLGALIENSVDVALEPVTAMTSWQTDINFIFPIAETMCNIYIRHQETSSIRDIFLAPFSPQLIFCVVCVALATSIALVIISRLTLHPKCKRMSCTDAIMWSTGILCQQGSSWRPSNPAASMLLIVCLFFALVTYNAYAAFITSVLSVRVANVGSLADVLESSNIKIGYVRNGADQMFLMSTKDVQLNAFYIRGYSDAENLVSSTEEGLVRAALHDYAFFSGQRAARTTIRSLSQARGRCALRELPVLSTRVQLAFPLPSGSPYARPLLISSLRLRSGGVLARLEAALVPNMPQCDRPSGFASARATDVRTALLVIVIGHITALLLGIGEFSWRNRSKLTKKLGQKFEILIK